MLQIKQYNFNDRKDCFFIYISVPGTGTQHVCIKHINITEL